MIYNKKNAVNCAKYLTILALVFSFCSQAPENCGDGKKLDTHNQFCFDGSVYEKCAGETYNPNTQFCSAGKLYNKCGGWDYDPLREFCASGKVFAKCGGDEFNPDSQICFFGALASKCGNNFYDPANQFCTNIGLVYDKCNGQAFDPATQDCSGKPAVPKCGTETYDTAALSCSNNKIYDKCDGQEYNPELGCNGAKTQPKCGGSAAYDDTKKFCYIGKLYDKCGGRDYNPSENICVDSTPINIEDVTPPDSTRPKLRVTVEAGTGAGGGGNYAPGATVTIRAGEAPAGKQFVKWTAKDGVVKFANANKDTTTFVMPGYAVTVTANFADTYQLTLLNSATGASSNSRFPAGWTINIKSGTTSGMLFHSWTTASNGVTIADHKSANTSFVMPANDVTIKSVWAIEDPRDKAIYKVTKIGNQTWMGQNLNYLPTSGKFWCYTDKADSCNKYGRLYDWNTAMNGAVRASNNPSGVQGVCPAGWHLPSPAEWDELASTVGTANAGTKLKAKAPDWNGTDDYGFTALISGGRYADGNYFRTGSWLTSFRELAYGPEIRFLRSDSTRMMGTNVDMEAGYGVRCVKNP